MVELAIVLPMLLMLVFGIIEFGRAYHTQLTLTHAAREAVREYALTNDPGQAVVVAKASATTLTADQMAVTTSPCTPGQPTTLTVSYPFRFFLPFLPSSPITISGEGVMRCGG